MNASNKDAAPTELEKVKGCRQLQRWRSFGACASLELFQPFGLLPGFDGSIFLWRTWSASAIEDIVAHDGAEMLDNFWMLTQHVGFF